MTPSPNLAPGTRLARHSTKYNGSLHYMGTCKVVHTDAAFLVTYMPPGVKMTSYRGQLLTRHHSLECYWRDRWFNLTVLWNHDWEPRMHYVNVATPAEWHDQTLRYIDLDLDVIWRAGAVSPIIDDEDEFLEHQQRFGYPADLVEQARTACADVVGYFAQRTPPFDGCLYAWRPHGPSITSFAYSSVAER